MRRASEPGAGCDRCVPSATFGPCLAEHRMTKRIIMLGLALSLSATSAALGRDSSRLVCSGIAEIDGVSPEKIALSIDFVDHRAMGGVNREYVLSSIYQGKLFQGKIISTSDVWGGKIVLNNSRN